MSAPRQNDRLTRMLTIAEVSDLLGVSTKTVCRLSDRGDLPRHKIGSQVRISEQDYRAYVAMRRDLR